MKDHKILQNFRVYFSLQDGGKGSLVVNNQLGAEAAATKAGEVLKGANLVKEKDWARVTRVRLLSSKTSAQELVEAMLVAVSTLSIPLAGFWHLSQIFTR